MTVKELIEQLGAYNPDMKIAVACENRCDPHPVTGAHVEKRHVVLWQDESIDVQGDGRERQR